VLIFAVTISACSSGKGGIAIAIAHELGLPVKLIGIGEGIDDLRPFDPKDSARALVGEA
jgi:fused signal recognition particle receptor